MAAAPRPWTVTSHGQLEQHDDDLWALTGAVPTIPGFTRTMHVIRRRDGALVFFNAVPMVDGVLEQLRRLGTPKFLLIPSDAHALDAPGFREKLRLEAYAPKEARAKLGPVVPLSGDLEAMPKDPALGIIPLGGLSNGEPAVLVKSVSGKSHLLFCDAVMNTGPNKGLMGTLMGLYMGMGEGPRCIRFFRKRVGQDLSALAASFEALAQTPNLASLQVSHGTPVTTAPAEALRTIAASLR